MNCLQLRLLKAEPDKRHEDSYILLVLHDSIMIPDSSTTRKVFYPPISASSADVAN
jgi:hypothetical protein